MSGGRASKRESGVDVAKLGRMLMRNSEHAALATSMLGAPYASLVLLATDLDATPLLMLSDLAQHSRNIAFDPRASLLLDGTEGHADRLDGPRLTLLGRAEAVVDGRLLSRFTARHPSSSLYASFADFHIYRFVVERGHLVAGFGRIEWIDGTDLLFAPDTAALAAAEPAIVAQLNQNHAAAIDRWARQSLGRDETGWRLTSIDPEGANLRCGSDTARLDFPAPSLTGEAVSAALFALAEKAEP
jgi:heme iron utilization protein